MLFGHVDEMRDIWQVRTPGKVWGLGLGKREGLWGRGGRNNEKINGKKEKKGQQVFCKRRKNRNGAKTF